MQPKTMEVLAKELMDALVLATDGAAERVVVSVGLGKPQGTFKCEHVWVVKTVDLSELVEHNIPMIHDHKMVVYCDVTDSHPQVIGVANSLVI